MKKALVTLLLVFFMMGLVPETSHASKYVIYHYYKNGKVHHAYRKAKAKKRRVHRKKKRYHYTVNHYIRHGKVRHKIVAVPALW